jgi:hypothetical protein
VAFSPVSPVLALLDPNRARPGEMNFSAAPPDGFCMADRRIYRHPELPPARPRLETLVRDEPAVEVGCQKREVRTSLSTAAWLIRIALVAVTSVTGPDRARSSR